MNMTQLIEAAQAQRRAKEAESVARSTHAAEIVAASKAADLADLLAMLGETATEMEIELVSHDVNWEGQVYNTRYRLKPRVWGGLAFFDVYRQLLGQPWRFIYEDRYQRDYYVEVGVEPGQMWARPWVLDMLAELQEQYERVRDSRIAEMQSWFSGAVDSDEFAAEARNALMTLAPERAAEWDAAVAAWQHRREERAAAVDAYVADISAWRRQYERALAENRRTVAGAQRALDEEFTRYEVAYAAVGDDADEPYRETAWSLEPDSDEDDYRSLFDSGNVVLRRLLRPLWVSEAVTQTLSQAGEGPWRRTHYVHDAGLAVHYLPWSEWELHRQLDKTITPLPAEPTPPGWVRDGLTAAERERITAVTRGMARVEIPF